MKDTSLLFSGPIVRAILDGRKTMTRRVVKPQPEEGTDCPYHIGSGEEHKARICPYGKIGTRFIPKQASRISLEITNVRVERLHAITEEDAIREGSLSSAPSCELDWSFGFSKACFKTLWDSINKKKYPWYSNPWVWVIEFKRVKP
jgi:hypothetical protein